MVEKLKKFRNTLIFLQISICTILSFSALSSNIDNYMVSAGTNHTCAIDANGVSCWGDNSYGQSSVPASLTNPRQVTAGGDHTCALDDNGITCWGDNTHGQSSVPTGLSNPTQIASNKWNYGVCTLDDNGITCWGLYASVSAYRVPASLSNPTQVAVGETTYCAIDNNEVTCWGENLHGENTIPPGLVNPSQLAVGEKTVCALHDNGIRCWGDDSYGQTSVPSNIVNPTQLSVGIDAACAVGDNGVTCWGDNSHGQATPPVDLLNPRQVTVGDNHACALDDNGITCWGANWSDQSSAPMSLVFDSGVTPAAPDIEIITTGLNVSGNWPAVRGALGYKLYYAPYPYTGPTSIGSIDLGNSTSFSYDLWDGATFYTALKAYNSGGESDYSTITLFSIQYDESSDSVAPYIGSYSGAFTGIDDSGTWTATVDGEGNVTGQICSSIVDEDDNDSACVSTSGDVMADGAFDMAEAVTDGYDFEGTIDTLGNLSGTWVEGGLGGTFTGSKDSQ